MAHPACKKNHPLPGDPCNPLLLVRVFSALVSLYLFHLQSLQTHLTCPADLFWREFLPPVGPCWQLHLSAALPSCISASRPPVKPPVFTDNDGPHGQSDLAQKRHGRPRWDVPPEREDTAFTRSLGAFGCDQRGAPGWRGLATNGA